MISRYYIGKLQAEQWQKQRSQFGIQEQYVEALCFWQLWTCQTSQTVDKQTAVRVNTCSSWAAECSNTSQLLLFFCTDLDPRPLTEAMELTWWYRFCLDMFISLPWTYPSVFRQKYGAFQILYRNTTNKT